MPPLGALESMMVTVILCTILVSVAYWRKVLTWDGALAAFGIGMMIGFFGDVMWLALLFIFLITSFAATKYKFVVKEAKHLQEGIRGERGAKNVLANGIVPTIVAMLSFLYSTDSLLAIVFITPISVAAADTLASELGMLSNKTYLITTFEKVKPGTNGGISLYGQFWAFIAAAYTSIVGWFFLSIFSPGLIDKPMLILIPLTIGFVGCQIDSVLGATLEERGLLTKGGVNLAATGLGAIIALMVMIWIS